MKKEIVITVSGVNASGKSRLLYFLKEFLRGYGFDVEFKGTPDHITEKSFDKHMGKDINEAIPALAKTRKIILQEAILSSMVQK